MSDSAPDSVSPDQLRQLFAKASSNDDDRVIGVNVPEMPLDIEEFGAVDLVVLLEQVLRRSNGATSLHLLHASSYLLHVAADSLEHQANEVDRYQSDGVIYSITSVFFRAATQALIRAIHDCVAQIESFIGPITRMHAERVGGGPLSRKGIVSDQALHALGIDVEAYDAELRRRLNDEH